MKAFFRLLVWITGFMFLIALLSLLSFPAFTIAVIAIWYFSKKDPNKRNRNIAVVVAVLSFFGILLSVGGGEEPEVAVEPKTEEVEVVEETEAEELEQEPEETEQEPEEIEEVVEEEPEPEPEPEVSQEYKNALKKAETYSDFMNMSKKGIYDQLTSEYGEGFQADSAQYAIDTIEADWNKNALEKAKVYYEDMAMSKDRVYEQLVSEYGEQFTAEEAQYAVDNLD